MSTYDLPNITKSLRAAVDAGDLGAIAENVAMLEILLRAEKLTRADYEELDNYYQQNWPDYTSLLRSGADEERLRAAEEDMNDVCRLLDAYKSLHGEEFREDQAVLPADAKTPVTARTKQADRQKYASLVSVYQMIAEAIPCMAKSFPPLVDDFDNGYWFDKRLECVEKWANLARSYARDLRAGRVCEEMSHTNESKSAEADILAELNKMSDEQLP